MLSKWMFVWIAAALMVMSLHLPAQKQVKETTFRKVWNKTEREMIVNTTADYFTGVLSYTGKSIPVFRADLDTLSIYLLLAAGDGGDGSFTVIRAGAGEFNSLGTAGGAEAQIRGEIVSAKSAILQAGDMTLLRIHRELTAHAFRLETETYYRLLRDSLVYNGQLVVRRSGNDELMQIYDGDGLNRYVRIAYSDSAGLTLHAELRQRYFVAFNAAEKALLEEWRFQQDGLRLISVTAAKKHFIPVSQAEDILQALLTHYASTRWQDNIRQSLKDRQRAHYFVGGFQALAELRPDFAPAFYHLAQMQAVLADTSRAYSNLATAIQLDPTLHELAIREAAFTALNNIPLPEPQIDSRPESVPEPVADSEPEALTAKDPTDQ